MVSSLLEEAPDRPIFDHILGWPIYRRDPEDVSDLSAATDCQRCPLRIWNTASPTVSGTRAGALLLQVCNGIPQSSHHPQSLCFWQVRAWLRMLPGRLTWDGVVCVARDEMEVNVGFRVAQEGIIDPDWVDCTLHCPSDQLNVGDEPCGQLGRQSRKVFTVLLQGQNATPWKSGIVI